MTEEEFQKEIKRADGHLRTGAPGGAVRIIRQMPDEFQVRVESLKLLIAVFGCDADWVNVEKFCAFATEAHPSEGHFWYMLAVAEENLGKHDDARGSLAAALRASPELLPVAAKDKLFERFIQSLPRR